MGGRGQPSGLSSEWGWVGIHALCLPSPLLCLTVPPPPPAAPVPQLLRKVAAAPSSSAMSLLEHVQKALCDTSAGLRLRAPDIDAVLEVLYDKREELEQRECSDVLQLLLCFLRHAR